jgi:serine/threonine protein kinase
MTKRLSFEKCALASGLLIEQQLDAAKDLLRHAQHHGAAEKSPHGDQQLADCLVEMGSLNAWQAKQLLDGRTKFTLGPYRIVDSLGQGGMGQVFKAEHPLMGRTVAVKVLPRDKSTPEAIGNFTREIQALAKLDHPKLVRALDAGHDGNVHYLVTQYVPGADLRKLVRRVGPLSMEAAARIISQVAEGLHHAHQSGMIHRDVKPGNVLVTPEGEAKLSDLGLAGPIGDEMKSDPRHGKIVGTADYISPDHIMDPMHPTPAWDVYSLGCTLYYAVTGKVPFPGGSIGDKVRAQCESLPMDPRLLNPPLTAEFVNVLADMMAKDPAKRIQSATAVIARLAPWASQPINPSALQSSPLRAGAVAGVVPPPVVAPPIVAAGDSATPRMSLNETARDFPSPWQQREPDSEDSMSVDIETMQPMSLLKPLLIYIVAPVALIALLAAVAWLLKMLF